MQAQINDNNSIYVADDRPASENHYLARFYFDPNTMGMTSGNAFFLFTGYSGTKLTAVLQVELRYSSGSYQIRASALNDSATFTNTAWFTISDAPHIIALDWQAATAAGANNGGVALWIDGIKQGAVSTVDNDTRRIDLVRLGAVSGIDKGTRGICYFDAFEAHRQTLP